MAFRSSIARILVRTFSVLRVRGAPTLLRGLEKLPFLRSTTGVAALGRSRIAFKAFDPYWAPYLWGGKPYEPDVEAILRKLSTVADKLFVDCGANIGYWTVQVSKPAYGFTELIAVEANPALIPLIRENIRLNGVKCEVVEAAIAEEAGLTVHLGGTHHHAAASVGDTGIPIPTVSLTSLLSERCLDGRMIVVKLDVEGCEVPAIKGAAGIAGQDLVYIVEDWPRSGMQVTDYLVHQGYAVLGVAPDGTSKRLHSVGEALEFNRATRDVYGPSNLIGCNPARADDLLRLLNGVEAAAPAD
jgi:FkbM family methyltransferase